MKKEDAPPHYHHGDLRAALVRSASRLLERSGPSSVSLRSVARAAGVSHAAPYRHFKDHHELMEAVAAAGFRALEKSLDDIAHRFPDDPRQQLQAACRAYVRENVAHPHRAHLMFGGFLDAGRRSAELAAAIDESFAKLIATIRRGEGRLFRPVPVRELVLTLWSATHGLTLLAISGQLEAFDPGSDVEERMERVIDHLLAGLELDLPESM